MKQNCPTCGAKLSPASLNLRVILEENVAIVQGERICLTAREAEVLSVLVDRAPRVASRDQIELEIYGGANDGPDSNCIDVMLSKLRSKLGVHGYIIENKWGRGWRIRGGRDLADA
tara:strand:+ start:318 stop:665 length:348 start_codon:yes stop_codon:yes gene_type:complete